MYHLAFDPATKALQLLQHRSKRLPVVDQWSDIGRADRMARRAAGLERDESAAKVNVSLNLVNQRILAMQDDTD